MSFPRAKIHRFNDVTSLTPSPADYNVETKQKVAGAIIPKGERFVDPKSPALSDNVSMVSSLNSTTFFRTPTIKQSGKSHHHSFTKTKSVELYKSPEELEALKEKIVECNNKDQTIRELTEHVEDMKQQLSDLEICVSACNNEKKECEEKIKSLKDEHENAIKEIKEKYEKELHYYSQKLPVTKAELAEVKKRYELLKRENKRELMELLTNIKKFENLYRTSVETFNTEIKAREEQLRTLKGHYKQLKIDHALELETLNQKHGREIQKIEMEMVQGITAIQKQLDMVQEENRQKMRQFENAKNEQMAQIKDRFVVEKLRLEEDAKAKIKQLEENFKEASILAEMQAKEKYKEIEEQYKLKLEEQEKEAKRILLECQVLNEKEKSDIQQELTNVKEEHERLLSENKNSDTFYGKCNELQELLDKATNELIDLRTQLGKEIEEHKTTQKQAENDKKAYEIALNQTHTTIEALKKRLLDSDHDVEQLKSELEATERSKLGLEERCNHLLKELETVTNLYEEVEICHEKTLKDAESNIRILEKTLLEKVNQLKDAAELKYQILSKKVENYKKELEMCKEHLLQQNVLNSKSQELIGESRQEIEKLEETNLKLLTENMQTREMLEKLKETCHDLRQENEELKKNYENDRERMILQEKKLKEADEMKEGLLEQSKNYEELLTKINNLEKRNAELEKKVETTNISEEMQSAVAVVDQESLIGPFREQLEAYEMEYKALVSQKSNIENEAKEMGLKYAELLGHQNQKQKIKYMVDLKKKNFELLESKEQLEKKVRSQTRLIEKLKRDMEKTNKTTPKKMTYDEADDLPTKK